MKATPQKRDFLLEARKERGLSQAEVACKAGINAASYCNIETGKRNPSVKLAQKLGRVLSFAWTEFFEEPDGTGPVSKSLKANERKERDGKRKNRLPCNA